MEPCRDRETGLGRDGGPSSPGIQAHLLTWAQHPGVGARLTPTATPHPSSVGQGTQESGRGFSSAPAQRRQAPGLPPASSTPSKQQPLPPGPATEPRRPASSRPGQARQLRRRWGVSGVYLPPHSRHAPMPCRAPTAGPSLPPVGPWAWEVMGPRQCPYREQSIMGRVGVGSGGDGGLGGKMEGWVR